MSTFDRYEMPSDPDWQIPGAFDSHFRWEYDDGRKDLLNLYRKGKKLQWNAEERIDWSQDLDQGKYQCLKCTSINIHFRVFATNSGVTGWIRSSIRKVGCNIRNRCDGTGSSPTTTHINDCCEGTGNLSNLHRSCTW